MQIVAGLEPENTNVFLQMLGRAARMGPAADAVQVRHTDAAQPISPATAARIRWIGEGATAGAGHFQVWLLTQTLQASCGCEEISWHLGRHP